MQSPSAKLPLLLMLVLLPCLAWGSPVVAKLKHSPCHKRSKLPGCLKKLHSTALTPYRAKQYKDLGLTDPMTDLGKRARGFYLTPYWTFRMGPEVTTRIMKRSQMNAVVVDMKGDLGRVLYPSKVELSKGMQRHLVKDPKALVDAYHKLGIYVIARVVCFKDSRLPYKRPDLAVRTWPKARRLFSAGANWIDAYSPEVQDYLIDLSREIQGFGFDEIQVDYIRFPKGKAATYATWLHKDLRKDKPDRATLIAGFLERLDRALSIPVSADVFGLTTLVDGDPRGLGQTIEKMAPYVEAISPMMYANGMDTYFKHNKVTEAVYNFIHCGLWRTRLKAPNIVLRPYLQSYPNNVEHFFGPKFIRQQVEVCRKAGCGGFLWWNATMKNGTAHKALRRLGRKYFDPYGSDTEAYKKPRNRPGKWCPAKGEVFQ